MEQHAQETNDAVRSLLTPVAGHVLLIPGAVVAEVAAYQEPAPWTGDNGTDEPWLLGTVEWRGARLPLVSVDALLTGTVATIQPRARLVVLKALGNDSRLPYFAIVAQGIPRLIAVLAQTLEALEDEPAPSCSHGCVLANGELAVMPDLEDIENRLLTLLDA